MGYAIMVITFSMLTIIIATITLSLVIQSPYLGAQLNPLHLIHPTEQQLSNPKIWHKKRVRLPNVDDCLTSLSIQALQFPCALKSLYQH